MKSKLFQSVGTPKTGTNSATRTFFTDHEIRKALERSLPEPTVDEKEELRKEGTRGIQTTKSQVILASRIITLSLFKGKIQGKEAESPT